MKTNYSVPRSGFTLIEVIVTFLLASIVAAVLLTIVSNSLRGFDRPREWASEAFSIQQVMENMVSSHREGTELSVLAASIGAESSDQNNAFGAYRVIQNHFIEFDGSQQEVVASTSSNLLVVTVQNNLGETLSRLFREP